MKGGVETGGTAALTAYVLSAMLEAGVGKDDPAIRDALLCLQSQDVNDVYTLAQMAYAYTLYDHTGSRRREVLRKLNQRAIVSGKCHILYPTRVLTKLFSVEKTSQV